MKQITDSELKTIEDIIAVVRARGDIPVPVSLPIARFAASVTEGIAPLTVKFTNMSTGADKYLWNLGVGATSTLFEPVGVYQAGTYTVSLQAINSAGIDTLIRTGYITASPPVPPATGYDLDLWKLSWANDGKTDETAKLVNALYGMGNGSSTTRKRVLFPLNKTIVVDPAVTNAYGYPGLSTGFWQELNGNGCTIKLKDNSTAKHWGQPFCYCRNGSWMHHFKFNGNKDTQLLDGGNGMGGPSSFNGVLVYGDTIFEYNEVYDVGAYTVSSFNMNNGIIRYNTIHDTWQYGIALKGDGAMCNNWKVYGNILYNCWQNGVKIAGASNTTVSDNTVTIPQPMPRNMPTVDGITYYSLDYPNANVTVTRNTVIGNGKSASYGIATQDSRNPGSIITDNIVSNCTVGIQLLQNGAVVTGNKISGCGTCISDRGTGNIKNNNTCT